MLEQITLLARFYNMILFVFNFLAIFCFTFIQCEKIFDVTHYGASLDASQSSSNAVEKAIAAAVSAGGGTVHFPFGHYSLSGPIHLKSHLHLQFANGTTVKFSDNFDHYLPMIPIVKSGLQVLNFSPLIYGFNVTDVKLSGKAVLDGSGQKWWTFFNQLREEHSKTGHWNKSSKWTKEFLSKNALLLSKHHSFSEPGFYRPAFFNLIYSSHITVSDLTFINSPWFTVAPYRSEYVTIDHVTVKNPSNAPNTDGIHPEACHHVVISNCFVSTGDDGIVITSETDKNTNAKYSSENITVNHCTVHSGHGGIVIGSAISGDVRDIHAHNLHFEGTLRGVRLKSTRDHGGIVENIYIKDITMKNISDEGITISAFYDVKNFDPHNIPSKTFDASKTPTFRNIHLTNVTGDSKLGLQIVGLPEKHFDKIELKQVHLVAKKEEIIVNADYVLKENFIYKIDKHLHDN